jgi:hypothetical protein
MIRRTAALVFALTLAPALVHAQVTVLTVTAASADVHSGPSTGTQVIGHAVRGMVLPVSRNLGSWVKIDWAGGPDGFGYLHVTMGRLGTGNVDVPAARPSRSPRASTAPAATPEPAAPQAAVAVSAPPPTRTSANERIAVSGPQGVSPISHVLGVGGLVGSMGSFGATARAWHNDRVGVDFRLTRDAMTSSVAEGRVTSLQVEPGIVFALLDHVSDYVWIRPYVGSGVSFRHQTLKLPAPSAIEPASDNGVGYRVFGGSELTFAGVTRFGLSAEVGYRRLPAPFPGFEADRLSVSLVGHWYIK